MANERLETNGILNNQSAGTLIFLGGACRTIVKISLAMPIGTTNIVAAGGAGTYIYVVGWQFSCDTDATTFKFTDSTPADLTAVQTFMKGGGEVVFPYKTLLLKTAANTILQGVSLVGNVTGTVWYCQF